MYLLEWSTTDPGHCTQYNSNRWSGVRTERENLDPCELQHSTTNSVHTT